MRAIESSKIKGQQIVRWPFFALIKSMPYLPKSTFGAVFASASALK